MSTPNALTEWLPQWFEIEEILGPSMETVQTEDLDPYLDRLPVQRAVAWLEDMAADALANSFGLEAATVQELLVRLPSAPEQRVEVLRRAVSFLIVAAANDMTDIFHPAEA